MLPRGVAGAGRQGGVWLEGNQGGLTLLPGDTVTATVESVAGNTALLRLMGTLVRARLEAALVPGETLTLLVASTDGPIWLRRLDPAAGGTGAQPGAGAGAAGGTGAQPGTGAGSAGGTAPGTAPGAGAGAAGGTTPGTAAAVPAGTGAPAGQGAAPPAATEVLPGLPAGAVPAGTDPALLQVAARALVAYRLPVETVRADRLARLLRSFPPEAREQAAGAAAWLLAHGGPATPETVRTLLDQATGARPWSLAARLEQLARALWDLAAGTAAAGQGDLARALSALARELAGWGYGGPAAAPGTAGAEAGDGGAGPGAPRPLPEALAAARGLLEQAPAGPAREQAAGALADAEAFLQNVRRQGQAPPGDGGWVMYPLPLHLPNLRGEAILARRRSGRHGGPGAPPEPEEVHLYLHGAWLGPLAVHLRQEGETVGATVTAATETARGALAEALPDLARSLAGVGLRPGRLAAVTGDAAPPAVLRPPGPDLPPRLDVKA